MADLKQPWQIWLDRRGQLSWLRVITLAILLAPCAKLLIDFDAVYHGARPLNDVIHRSGFWALVFLGVTLAVTPFRRIVRYGQLVDVRRMIGVAAFFYICLLYTSDAADE